MTKAGMQYIYLVICLILLSRMSNNLRDRFPILRICSIWLWLTFNFYNTSDLIMGNYFIRQFWSSTTFKLYPTISIGYLWIKWHLLMEQISIRELHIGRTWWWKVELNTEIWSINPLLRIYIYFSISSILFLPLIVSKVCWILIWESLI